MLRGKIKRTVGFGKIGVIYISRIFKNCLYFISGKKQKDSDKINNCVPVQYNIYFGDQHYNNNITKGVKNSKIIKSNDSNLNLNSNNQILSEKNDELKRNNYFCYEMTEALLDNITEIYVKIAEKSPEMKVFLEEQKETRRIMSQLNTLSKISDKKNLYNKKFFKYFDYPYS